VYNFVFADKEVFTIKFLHACVVSPNWSVCQSNRTVSGTKLCVSPTSLAWG
jgi:hypothetical protein